MLVPFQDFQPDRSRFNPARSELIQNAQPTADGWKPIKALTALSGALPAAPRGAVSVKTDAGTWKIFVGTAANLYEIDTSDFTFDEISRSTDDYSLASGEYWQWCKFGNTLIATAPGATFPQFINLGSYTTFANLTNASFSARYCAVVGDFLVFGDVAGNPRDIRWSGVNDATFWTNGQRGSDTQSLPSGGDIQGIVSQAAADDRNAIIFQENAISTMHFTPEAGIVFRFSTLNAGKGVYAPRSIVNIGPNDWVYLAKDGFYRGPQMQPIGAERVDKWFFDEVAADQATLVSGVLDPFEKMVWWRYQADDATNYLLGYDYQLDKWCFSTNNAVELMEAATPGYTLEALDTFSASIDALSASLDSRLWKGGIPGFAGWDTSNQFGFLDGTNLEAILETDDKALNYPRRSVTGNIQLMIDTDSAQVAIAGRETQRGTITYGDYASQETGTTTNLSTIPTRTSGKWHRFRVKIPAGTVWSNAVGIDVDSVTAGAR